MFCGNCGENLPTSLKFCTSCGVRILSEGNAEIGGPTTSNTEVVAEPLTAQEQAGQIAPSPASSAREQAVRKSVQDRVDNSRASAIVENITTGEAAQNAIERVRSLGDRYNNIPLPTRVRVWSLGGLVTVVLSYYVFPFVYTVDSRTKFTWTSWDVSVLIAPYFDRFDALGPSVGFAWLRAGFIVFTAVVTVLAAWLFLNTSPSVVEPGPKHDLRARTFNGISFLFTVLIAVLSVWQLVGMYVYSMAAAQTLSTGGPYSSLAHGSVTSLAGVGAIAYANRLARGLFDAS